MWDGRGSHLGELRRRIGTTPTLIDRSVSGFTPIGTAAPIGYGTRRSVHPTPSSAAARSDAGNARERPMITPAFPPAAPGLAGRAHDPPLAGPRGNATAEAAAASADRSTATAPNRGADRGHRRAHRRRHRHGRRDFRQHTAPERRARVDRPRRLPARPDFADAERAARTRLDALARGARPAPENLSGTYSRSRTRMDGTVTTTRDENLQLALDGTFARSGSVFVTAATPLLSRCGHPERRPRTGDGERSGTARRHLRTSRRRFHPRAGERGTARANGDFFSTKATAACSTAAVTRSRPPTSTRQTCSRSP